MKVSLAKFRSRERDFEWQHFELSAELCDRERLDERQHLPSKDHEALAKTNYKDDVEFGGSSGLRPT